MKVRVVHLLLLLVLTATVVVISGCASADSENDSVRPWNSAEGWQNGNLGDMMDQQHR